jgi:hypothetical protein
MAIYRHTILQQEQSIEHSPLGHSDVVDNGQVVVEVAALPPGGAMQRGV